MILKFLLDTKFLDEKHLYSSDDNLSIYSTCSEPPMVNSQIVDSHTRRISEWCLSTTQVKILKKTFRDINNKEITFP